MQRDLDDGAHAARVVAAQRPVPSRTRRRSRPRLRRRAGGETDGGMNAAMNRCAQVASPSAPASQRVNASTLAASFVEASAKSCAMPWYASVSAVSVAAPSSHGSPAGGSAFAAAKGRARREPCWHTRSSTGAAAAPAERGRRSRACKSRRGLFPRPRRRRRRRSARRHRFTVGRRAGFDRHAGVVTAADGPVRAG